MNYYEINFHPISSFETEVIGDLLTAELAEIGFESFVAETDGVKAYIAENLYSREVLSGKLEDFPLPGVIFEFTEKKIKGQDWNEEWEKNYFKPIIIRDECIIHASFHDIKEKYPYDIVIDPKMAFGTGNHETTRLMINHILKLNFREGKVLDMGCGTAVLAILANMCGAKEIVAIDIDEWAYNNALENIRLNNTPEISVLLGGVEKIPSDVKFDVILANINRNILLNDIPAYAKALSEDGVLFMSGFYLEDVPVLVEVCEANGLRFEYTTTENNWASICVTCNNI